jgi:two-component system copper resistance phosphate regulon response regulator CusR
MRILLAEGDTALSSFVRKGLEAEHYAVDTCMDGAETVFLWQQFGYDLLLLDLNLATGTRGHDLLLETRAAKPSLPILALCPSARAEDRARALDLGADDVLARPFSFCELAARVRALLRRGRAVAESVLRVADLSLDRVEHSVERAGRAIPLTAKEFALLEYLMRNHRRALSRAMIVEHVWNLSFDTSTNIVDVYINYLRRKVDDGFDPPLIHTVRGVGYRLEVPEGAEAAMAARRSGHPLANESRRLGSVAPIAMAAGRTSRR